MLPATQHDAVLWVSGGSYDVVFDVARAVIAALASHRDGRRADLGWPYHPDLDLTGFIDGTENPTLVEATGVVDARGSSGAGGRPIAAAVASTTSWTGKRSASTRPGAGHGPAQVRQRRAADPKAEGDLHVARNDQDDFGKIFRRNIGWGTLSEHGTIFLGLRRGPADPRADATRAWRASMAHRAMR